jgi:hypothetical protein
MTVSAAETTGVHHIGLTVPKLGYARDVFLPPVEVTSC